MKTKEFDYLLRSGVSTKKNITTRENDFPQWYQDVISAADLAENGPSKGSMIIKPYGYAIWQNIQSELDKRIRSAGVPNLYFPLFIPESLLKKEENHIEGFAPEVAVVTHAGGKELEEKLIVRPTSETIMYDSFSRWIQSYRDLPLLTNQWNNVVRWELRPRLFLRSTEFLWQEGHTAHASANEADEFAKLALGIYQQVAEDVMAISVLAGEKSEAERFAGAHKTYTLEPMMQDGKALQFATSHNLGDNFAKAFDIYYSDENGEQKPVWQTSWGMSTRSIGGLIMTHSDDKGLVLPPNLAPLKVVITTVGGVNKDVESAANDIAEELDQPTLVDDRDISTGEKLYGWEKRGVPIRVEIGPRDIESKQAILVIRDTGEKKTVEITDIKSTVVEELESMQSRLLDKSKNLRESNTVKCSTEEEAVEAIKANKFAEVSFDVTAELEDKLKKIHGITVRCTPFSNPDVTVLAKAY
ncbi:MAG: prolyl-tRNA synthetase [Patescibacteria group bacterium]|jgi:prolyl-tRNA synthetase|nr:prolyl-tRNA synthetase [Patescibacteria group bacterium]